MTRGCLPKRLGGPELRDELLDLDPQGEILDDQLVRLENLGFVLETGSSVAVCAAGELGGDRAGESAEDQGRRGRARILVTDAALAEVRGAALRSLQRDGRPHAFLAGLERRLDGLGQRRTGGKAFTQGSDGRRERVDHRLLAFLCGAELDDALERRA